LAAGLAFKKLMEAEKGSVSKIVFPEQSWAWRMSLERFPVVEVVTQRVEKGAGPPGPQPLPLL